MLPVEEKVEPKPVRHVAVKKCVCPDHGSFLLKTILYK
jgi:hypothetical protein